MVLNRATHHIYSENLKIGWTGRSASVPFRNKLFVIAAKNYAKLDIKFFRSCPILLDFFSLFQIFFQRLYNFELSWYSSFRELVNNVNYVTFLSYKHFIK